MAREAGERRESSAACHLTRASCLDRNRCAGIERAYAYIAEFNPHAAAHVAETLLASGDSLVNFPHRGRLVQGTNMREVVSVYPYTLRYRIDGDVVVILRVRHTSRRPTSP